MAVNQERALYWNGVFNQELSGIVEEYQSSGKITEPGKSASDFLWAGYQEAMFLGLESHPFVRLLGRTIAFTYQSQMYNMASCLSTMIDVIPKLSGTHNHQLEALMHLKEVLVLKHVDASTHVPSL